MSSKSPIYKIVYIFRFIKDTGILPAALINQQLGDKIQMKNRNIVMLILMTNFIRKLAKKVYRHQNFKVMNGKYKHTPQSHWKNNYPIVLVHGYCGYAPDSCWIFSNYFLHALRTNVQSSKDVNKDIYIAVVSPLGCIHDRACELYQ